MVKIISLIKKAQKGNAEAFLKLFQQYEEILYRTAFIYVKNEEDALDVVQETAYRSFKSISTLMEPKYFKTWLTKITISCSLDLLRKRKKVIQLQQKHEVFISDTSAEDLPLSMTLQDVIDLLDEEEKNIIIFRFYHDLTIKEMAETLDIPLGTAKTILYRALKKLRKELKGDGVNEQ